MLRFFMATLLALTSASTAQSPAVMAQSPAAAASQPPLPLVPMPRELRISGAEPIPKGVRISCDSCSGNMEDKFTLQDLTRTLAERHIPASGTFTIQLVRNQTSSLPPEAQAEGYIITPGTHSVTLSAASASGLFYAAQTLKQMIVADGSAAVIHLASIQDWPAMPYRGMQDDMSRGPIPTLEFQKQLIRTLASFKVNIYSPYFEHTQQYASNPLFAPPGGSISAADAREIVAYAAQYHITIVPDQEAFGHLHHNLKWEQYSTLAETPHGSVLAPGQPASLMLISQMFTELAQLYPGPFLHIGADETVDLGLGQTKPDVDSRGLGPVYLDFLEQIQTRLAPLHRRLLFWGDIAQTIVQGATAYSSQAGAPSADHPDPNILRNLPAAFKQGTIAVAWWYAPHPSGGFAKFLNPFTSAGFETWVAPGVNNWSVVFPDNNDALADIQGFVAEGQRQHSTGVLNTTWYDDGEGLPNQNWYGLLFGAAAAWQPGTASIPDFEGSYGRVFHGDATGALDQAQIELMACHELLRVSAHVGDGSNGLFWIDPWSTDGQKISAKLLPYAHDLRLHAERALTLIANARASYPSEPEETLDRVQGATPLPVAPPLASDATSGVTIPNFNAANAFPSNPTTLRHPDAIDALELGARRMDFIGLKFQLADEIVQGYSRAQADALSTDKKTHAQVGKELSDIRGINGRLEDVRDTYSLLRDLYQQEWLRTNRPYALRPILEHYDSAIQLWQSRIDRLRSVERQYSDSKSLPTPFELGMPSH
jgi:hypothetical protein